MDALKRNELDMSVVVQKSAQSSRPSMPEQLRLLRLCSLILSTSVQRYAEWEAALDSVLLPVLQTRWKLKHALENITAKLSIKHTPTLQEWVKIVGKGDTKDNIVVTSPESSIHAQSGQVQHQDAEAAFSRVSPKIQSRERASRRQ